MPKNNKKQPKDHFPDNMPTGLNMTWWYTDDIETLMASMQLKIDYLQQRLEKAETEIEKLNEEKATTKKSLVNLSNKFKTLKETTEKKIDSIEESLNHKLEKLESKLKSK